MKDISFIVVAHNEEKTISRCLDSIVKQENIGDYEIVVVDDGSTDKTAQMVLEFQKKDQRVIFRQLIPNQGRGAARLEGANNATGKYFAYIDSDIVLPTYWLKTCLTYMSEYDAVGGVAVPDGDVNYVYGLLDISPKVVSPTTTISGSNGLYKSEIFKKINFGKNFRDGEDSVFNKKMLAEGFKTLSIQTLIVEHREARGFFKALVWLYQTGRGATRQFKQYRDVRLPDIAYFLLVLTAIFSIAASVYTRHFELLVLPFLFILLVDIAHFNIKFYFKLSYIHKYIFGVFVYWMMLICYFAGRTAGWFVPVKRELKKKKVMVCFDYEGKFGMPFGAEYNLAETTSKILSVLKKHNVKAVFFTVGKIVLENPELVKQINDDGHEVGVHGFEHEHLDTYNEKEFEVFKNKLTIVEDAIEKIINKRPVAFRSPYLMGPKFYSVELYKILKAHGYEWVSNREIRYPEEIFRPDRVKNHHIKKLISPIYKIFLFLFNIRMIFTENIDKEKGVSRIISNTKWLFGGAKPFMRYDLLEVPLHSPMDCDLLGLPKPTDVTSQKYKSYMVNSYLYGTNRKGELYTVTLHDWIIGSSNRIDILDELLLKLSKKENVEFVNSPNI